jgi:hypothetical protein
LSISTKSKLTTRTSAPLISLTMSIRDIRHSGDIPIPAIYMIYSTRLYALRTLSVYCAWASSFKKCIASSNTFAKPWKK